MTLSNDYRRQFGWRAWASIFDALAPLHGQTVLDLGCGVGDLAAEFVSRGARVVGVDMNEELLHEAQLRQLANAEFLLADIHASPHLDVAVDGLWCSFTAAYFPDLPTDAKKNSQMSSCRTDGFWLRLEWSRP
jgi:ubiquinone/menaquinone biosynthesis C-methylase UbiE